MKKIIEEGSIYPKGYGIAYREWWSGRAVCYPIPINILVALGRKLHYFLGRYHGSYKSWYDDYIYTQKQVAQVYCAITNNQMSYHNYDARSVITMFEDYNLDKSITQEDVKMFMETDSLKELKRLLTDYFELESE